MSCDIENLKASKLSACNLSSSTPSGTQIFICSALYLSFQETDHLILPRSCNLHIVSKTFFSCQKYCNSPFPKRSKTAIFVQLPGKFIGFCIMRLVLCSEGTVGRHTHSSNTLTDITTAIGHFDCQSNLKHDNVIGAETKKIVLHRKCLLFKSIG